MAYKRAISRKPYAIMMHMQDTMRICVVGMIYSLCPL